MAMLHEKTVYALCVSGNTALFSERHTFGHNGTYFKGWEAIYIVLQV